MHTPAPETVHVRLLPGVLGRAVDAIKSRRWVGGTCEPLSLAIGRDLVVIVPGEFEPTGSDRAEPRDVAMYVRCAHRDPRLRPRPASARWEPIHGARRHGLLEFLVLDDGRLWASFRHSDGAPAAVIVKEVPGHRLAVLGDAPVPPAIELPRTSRLLGLASQVATWVGLHVAIVGVGRTGSQIADAVCAQGIRRLTLIDDDILEPGNLDGMSLAAGGDVGAPKVELVGRALCVRFPELSVIALRDSFPSVPTLAAAACADVLITSVDRDEPRLAANHLSRRLLQLHLDVGTAGDGREQGADLRLLTPTGLCLLCQGGVADLRPGPRRPGNSSRAINSIAANLGVQMLINSLSGGPSAAKWIRATLSTRPLSVTTQDLTQARGNPACPWCAPAGEAPPGEGFRVPEANRTDGSRS